MKDCEKFSQNYVLFLPQISHQWVPNLTDCRSRRCLTREWHAQQTGRRNRKQTFQNEFRFAEFEAYKIFIELTNGKSCNTRECLTFYSRSSCLRSTNTECLICGWKSKKGNTKIHEEHL